MLSDEERMITGGGEITNVGGRPDSALGDAGYSGGHSRGEVERPVDGHAVSLASSPRCYPVDA